MNSVLIVDDTPRMLDSLSRMIRTAGYDTVAAANGEAALTDLAQKSFDIVLLDLNLHGLDGLAALRQIRKISPASKVIMLTGHGEIKDAVQAMQLGAVDFVLNSIGNAELLMMLQHTCDSIPKIPLLIVKDCPLKNKGWPDDPPASNKLAGKSLAIQTILKLVCVLAPTNLTVVLQGESGVGKNVVASLIHQRSHRRDKPFVPVDCGTIPDQLTESILFGHEKGSFTGADSIRKGHFERAHEGTLFLDEIGNTSEATQAKLLRIVQEKKFRHVGGNSDIPVDVRLIIASNVNLDEAVRARKFRADLFHRLNEFVITIPPLRERRDDIPVLAHQFLREITLELHKDVSDISPAATQLLREAAWPGNVRELRNVVRRAVLLAEHGTITPDDIAACETNRFVVPACLRALAHPSDPSRSNMNGKVAAAREEIEKEELARALRSTDGNKAKAARILQIDRSTLYAMLAKYDMSAQASEQPTAV